MSDILRHTADLIERFGYLRLRRRPTRLVMELLIQFEDKGEAVEFAARQRKRVYPYADAWSVYVTGERMLLLMAVARDYMCPAHRRVVELAVQVRELSKKRKLLGKLQIRGKRSRQYRDGCRKKNVTIGQVRDRVFDELARECGTLEERCPIWGALGPPMQLRAREWWRENRPVENAAWEEKRASMRHG